MTRIYVPILKARVGELRALEQIKHQPEVLPLFEIPQYLPPPNASVRAKSAVTDASYFLDDIKRHWSREFLLDPSRAVTGHNGAEQWWHVLSALVKFNPGPALIPVFHITDEPQVAAAAESLIRCTNRAAIRVKMSDSSERNLIHRFHSLASAAQISLHGITAILDWEDRLDELGLDALEAASTQVIKELLRIGITEIVIAGTPDTSRCTQEGDWQFTRREWWLWLRLKSQFPTLVYGDYALYPPSSPVPARPLYGHLRYSSADQLWVHRRKQKQTGGLGGAFTECCIHLTTNAHFLGANFSGADQKFGNVATGTVVLRKSELWRVEALIHHVTLVTKQLSAPPSPPAPGTP